VALAETDKSALVLLDQPNWWLDADKAERLRDPLLRAAAWYFLRARSKRGLPVDPVARFHLGNGARLERINWLADTSERAMAQGCGLMVNYLYDLDDIEKNHEAYAEGRTVVAANAVQRLLRPPLELVPIAG
jgi:malonyl-CoA decarboxylase